MLQCWKKNVFFAWVNPLSIYLRSNTSFTHLEIMWHDMFFHYMWNPSRKDHQPVDVSKNSRIEKDNGFWRVSHLKEAPKQLRPWQRTAWANTCHLCISFECLSTWRLRTCFFLSKGLILQVSCIGGTPKMKLPHIFLFASKGTPRIVRKCY